MLLAVIAARDGGTLFRVVRSPLATGIEFCLLGPITVRTGGVMVAVPTGKQRAVLAALLLSAGRVVSLDELIEVVWGDDPPQSARVTIRNYVGLLRKALGAVAGARVGTEPRGYLIRVQAGELDVSRFEAHLDAVRAAVRDGAWEAAAEEARAGLALWRGEPLADVESDLLAVREVPRLGELRLEALEARIGADLHLGRHGQVVAELRQLAAVHPVREQVRGLLMLALYRDGRQAEALAVYQDARQVLVDELGIEPGAGLRDLHQRILAADPALALAEPPPTASGPGPAVPRELPAGVRHFTGRADELEVLARLLKQPGEEAPGTVVISAIGGTAGVGKTALALHFAHQFADRFPDGQLYVNLRGFDPSGVPVTPAEAVRGFLDTLGVPPERIPAQQEAQAGLYRSLLAGKQMLMVLDNARDEGQVRPLLPASPASLVLVTSRNQLAGLAAADGARLVSLDVLTQAEAVQLLTARLGTSRATAELEAVNEIASLCACLPLALAVAAARAAARPRFPLTQLAAELRDAVGRLDALDAGDPAASVRAVFSWSYRQLSAEAVRMFRLLGLHPGPDISVPAAASLAAADEAQARRLLRELARYCLITEHAPGRYAFHDLLRAYAASQARDRDSQPDRDAAIGRILDHYLHTAEHGSMLLQPTREPLTLAPPRPGTCPERPADRRQAMAWFETEHHVLLAAVAFAAETGADRHAWQLPRTMMMYLNMRGYLHERVTIIGIAVAAATRLDDLLGQAISLHGLSGTHMDMGDYDQARAFLERCLPLFQRLGDHGGEATVQQSLTAVAWEQGRHADALHHSEQALRLHRAIGDESGEAASLNNVAWHLALVGDYQQARAVCEQSLALIAKLGGRHFEYTVRDTLGYIELHLGNIARATEQLELALDLCRDHGNRLGEAHILEITGDARRAAGELPQARQAWQQALTIYEDLDHPLADQVRAKLADTADLGRQPVRPPEQERRLTQRLQPQHDHQQPPEPQPEPAMRRAPVPETVQVIPHRLKAQPLLHGLPREHVVPVLPLRPRGDLNPTPEQVEAARQVRFPGRAHVVERPDARRVPGDERELVPGPLGQVRRDGALARRVQVRAGASANWGAQDFVRAGHRDPRERDRGHGHLGAQVLADLRAVRGRHRGEHVGEHPFLEVHHVLDVADPGQFDVDAGELGGVPGGVGRLGAEHRSDLEDPVHAGRDRHLLVELRGLRQVGAAAEVAELEHLGAGLRRGAHELGGVHLGAAAGVGVLAHGPLDGRLHGEHEPRRCAAAHVEEAPVKAALRAGVRVDGQRGGGTVLHRDRLGDDFKAAQADDRVGGHPAGDADGRLDGQPVEFGLQGAAVAPSGNLHGAGVVAHEHELHGALQAQRLHPAGDRDRLAGVVVQG
jgi:DNA-binding SARP family transcriptional activator